MEQKKVTPLTVAKATAIKDTVENKCEHCRGVRAQEVHHIKFRKHGGQNWEDNLIALCGTCHKDAHDFILTEDELRNDISKRTDKQIYRIKRILQNVRAPKNDNSQEESYSSNTNDSIVKNDFVSESSSVHPKINTIKMQVCKGLLEGKNVIQLSKIIYPDREQGKSTYHLMYRQVQEVEKDGLIRVVQKPTSESDYTDVKIEEITDGVFGLKKANKVATSKKRNAKRETAVVAICDEGLTFEEAALKYDHMGDGERDGSQKVGNLVKRHIDLAIKDGNIVKNDDGTYSRT